MTVHNNLFPWVKHHKTLAVFAATLLVVGACKAAEMLTPAKEIALIIGEPRKDMQARSTAEIGPVYEGRHCNLFQWIKHHKNELSRFV